MTTIGVALSVYNGGATIDAALASVAAQTRKPDQVVVVDDGSTDDTAQRVAAWAGVLPLKVVRQPNSGVAAGRTVAVDRIETDLVLSLDADDVWLPHHLRLLETRHASSGGIVSPRAVPWLPDRPIVWNRAVALPPKDRGISRILVMNWIFAGSIFERSAYQEAGGRYRFDGCEDWDLWLRLTRIGVSADMLDEPSVLYRVSPTSLSADDRGLSTEIVVLEAFRDENADPELGRVVARSLRHRHARLALRVAYEAASMGTPLAARRSALKTLRGPVNVAGIGLAMLAAPQLTVRQRTRIRSAR